MTAGPVTSSRSRRKSLLGLLLSALLVATISPWVTATAATPVQAAAPSGAATASGFLFYKHPGPQPLCTGSALNVSEAPFYSRDDCGFVVFTLSEAPTGTDNPVKAKFYAVDSGTAFATVNATKRAAANEWSVSIRPDANWAAGEIRMVIEVDGNPAGETQFGHNLLGVTIAAAPGTYKPGEAIPVSGEVYKYDPEANLADIGVPGQEAAPGAKFDLKLVTPDGAETQVENITAGDDGTFQTTIPGSATAGVTAGPKTNYQVTLGIAAVNATYTDPSTGKWAAKRAGSGAVTLQTPPKELLLDNSFVSAVGWVKPGATYPSRIFVRNLTDRAFSGAKVVAKAPAGTTFRQVSPSAGAGTASISADGKTITWNLGTVAAAPANGETVRTLVIESKAATLLQDPQLVWKDLSTTATLTTGAGTASSDRSHGPRVIPRSEIYDTARYGDRPFPVVPVDYLERKHLASNSGDELAGKINSPTVAGSTFNLFQEMSLRQLFPNGTVPSSGIASRGFEYEPGFNFTQVQPNGVCRGATVPSEGQGTPAYPERIRDGFYQLPGNTEYYGSDKFGSALPGAIGGVGPLIEIDLACGPTRKLVYD